MTRFSRSFALCAGLLSAGPALAQSGEIPLGWLGLADGLALWQGSSDLAGGGSYSARRFVMRVGGLYTFENRVSVGLVSSGGKTDFDFGSATVEPFGDANEYRISAPIRFPVGNTATALIVPQLRYDYESGASANDGFTWGAFGGISWQVSDTLSIGPGLGVYSRINDNDLDIFPALLIDWDFAPRWSLSTGTAPGSTEGPGLVLDYELADNWTLSLAGRYESLRFKLNNTGMGPGGVGQDRSLPVVMALTYSPAVFFNATVFAGAKFNGTLKVEDAFGTVVGEQDYDTAPVAGFAFRLFF